MPGPSVTYQHESLQPHSKPKELHALFHRLLITPPGRALHHSKSSLAPSCPVQREESGDAGDESGMAGANIGSHGGGSNFESPAGDCHGVEENCLVLAVQAPVQFEAEQVLRIRADFVHRLVFVADIGVLVL